jgi:Protein kinase domain/Domain of unknown function (DUF4384)
MSTPPDDDRTQYVPPPSPAAGSAQPAEPDFTLPADSLPEVDFEPTQLAPGALAAAAPPSSAAPKPASASASSAGDSGNALPVGTYLSEFELTGVIGEGGFGIVYHAWDHSLQRKVALKEYMPASLASREKSVVQVRSLRHKETFDAGLKSFINEARLLAQFDHPSLVKVYRFWEANGTAYMVMPLYEGTTLKDKLRQMGSKPDEAWLMALLAPLTDALAVIHKENCFHRDIAPDNVILLAGSERPLLLDFGAARRVIGDMTQALTVILKPGYAPVEQYAESPDMKQGSWTDVYALAATVHWAIMGKTPPPSVSRLMNDTFQPLSKTASGRYSERFLAAMDRALAVRPENRTPTIAALRADIGLDQPWTVMPGTQTLMTQGSGRIPGTMTPTAMPGAGTMAGMPGATVHAAPVSPDPTAYARTQMANPAAMAGAEPTMMVPRPVEPERPDEVTMMAPRRADGSFEKTMLATQTRAAADAGYAPTVMVPARTPAPPPEATAPDKGGNKSMVWVGAAAALLVVGGVGAYFAMSGPKVPATAPVALQPVPAPAPAAAPVAAAPQPAAPPAPSVFNVREQFDGVVSAQTAGFKVDALPERTELSIRKKDKLRFDVLTARDGFLHVLARGPDGSLTVLFPNDNVKDARVKAGQRIKLPHDSWAIEVGEPTGTEQLLVIVASTPRDFSQIAEEKAYIFRTVPVGNRANTLLQQWKAATPILLGSGPKDCQGAGCDEYGAAMFSVQVVP